MVSYTLLHSGQQIPDSNRQGVRGEGVSWRESGEVWEAVSSCLVTARLKAVCAGQTRPETSKKIFVSVSLWYQLML